MFFLLQEPKLTCSSIAGVGPSYQLSCSNDFNVGDVRPDIELHIYYFSESVSSEFDVGFIPSD